MFWNWVAFFRLLQQKFQSLFELVPFLTLSIFRTLSQLLAQLLKFWHTFLTLIDLRRMLLSWNRPNPGLVIVFQTPLTLAVIHDDQVGGCVGGQWRSRMLSLAPLPHVDLSLPGTLKTLKLLSRIMYVENVKTTYTFNVRATFNYFYI